jgi:hypothetical protein
MYREVTEKDLTKRLKILDKKINSDFVNAIDILNLIHTLFPLKYVMPKDFTGTHTLIINDQDKLQACVWCNNKSYYVAVN